LAQETVWRLTRRAFGALLAAALLCCAALAGAASPPANGAPSWSALTAQQREALAPLAGEWDKLGPEERKEWLGVAKRYPKMTSTGKKRVQTRMSKWAALTPQQREQARENYRKMKESRKKKKDLGKQWSEYQSLHPQEPQGAAPGLKAKDPK
jgi:hypothetical protein